MASRNTNTLVIDGNIFGLQVHGGVSNYVSRLHREFLNLGQDPLLVLPRHLTYEGFDSVAISSAARAHREILPARIAQYLPATTGWDNVVFHSAYYRRPARQVSRYVVTVHDFTYERFRTGPALWIHHRAKSRAIIEADAIVCISEATRRDVLEFCPHVDPARLHVIHHGVDTETFYPDATGVPEGMDRTVLFVGQRVHYKRFDLAIQSVSLEPDLRLGFVGPAPSASEIAMLDKLIPGRWIHFGRVENSVLRALYASAFAFIFPSDYEGFGLPVLEAMACGCPTVTSADPALREVGGAAALFAAEQEPDLYVAALNLLKSPDVRTQLISLGLKVASRSRWRDCALLTLDVLNPKPR
jgi:mannosyltransferase